ncbi:hypothetical protein BDW66DRAFT_161391 [Aspergillus desertorum]
MRLRAALVVCNKSLSANTEFALTLQYGRVGQEVIDALVATKKHEILLLSRKDAPSKPLPSSITWIKTDCGDVEGLAAILKGVHTVLSFVVEQETETSPVQSPIQRRLIDASIAAGVKTFAPSEWASSTFNHLPWYAYKASIRTYLADLNKENQVREYALSQPGLFTNYLGAPHKTTSHVPLIETPIDLLNRRAILVDGAESALITLTTVSDFTAVLVQAIKHEGPWPVTSGIAGCTMTLGELITLGEKVRGGKFTIEKVRKEDFLAGTWETSWAPVNRHPSIPEEMRRKVRCIFASAEHAVCNNCRRRGTACVSQELPDSHALGPTSRDPSQVGARLGRVEELVEQLVNAQSAPGLDGEEEPNAGSPLHRAVASRPPATTRHQPPVSGRYEGLAGDLLAAWPSENDLETISSLPIGLLCLPLPVNPGDAQAAPPDAHPILIARAVTLVTTNDELTRSVEGLECIMLEMDYYLSLMLGLPQTAAEGRFAIPEDLSRFDPRDRLERLHCAVSRRIVQRNDADCAAEMSPQWWLPPTFSKDSDLVADTVRLMIQFTHHHLLARLHLPHMLRSAASTDHNHDRSKTIAVNASRELLSRYILFRSANPVDYYCRGCDFLAFVATTIMCLAHINTNAHSNANDASNSDPLRTAEIIASTAVVENSVTEAIAPKLTRSIRHLLDVESNSANGTIYSTSTSSSTSDGDEGEFGEALSQGGKALQIRIPYFGTISCEGGQARTPCLPIPDRAIEPRT